MNNATFAIFVGVASSFLYASLLNFPILGSFFFLLSAAPLYTAALHPAYKSDLLLTLATTGATFALMAILGITPQGSSLTAFLSFCVFIFIPVALLKKSTAPLIPEKAILSLLGGALIAFIGVSFVLFLLNKGSLYTHIYGTTLHLIEEFFHQITTAPTPLPPLAKEPTFLNNSEDMALLLTYATGLLSSIILTALHTFSFLTSQWFFKKQNITPLLPIQKQGLNFPLFIGIAPIFLGFAYTLFPGLEGSTLFYAFIILSACSAPTVLQGGVALGAFMQKFLPQAVKIGVYIVLALVIWLLPVFIILLFFIIGLGDQIKKSLPSLPQG